MLFSRRKSIQSHDEIVWGFEWGALLSWPWCQSQGQVWRGYWTRKMEREERNPFLQPLQTEARHLDQQAHLR